MTNKLRVILALSLSIAAAGCGGNDPLNVFENDPGPPTIQAPVASTAVSNNPTLSTQYNSSTLSFVFGLTGGTFSAFAPARGLITAIEISNTGYLLTIVYNAQYSVKVGQLISTNRRVGDFVEAGSEIGTVAGDGIHKPLLQMIANGSSVCPLSYFDATGLQIVINTGLTQPCGP